MRKFLFIIFLLSSFIPVFAAHITGGEFIYTYVGPGSTPASKIYRITLRLFRDNNCPGNCAPMPGSAPIAIFNNSNNALVGTIRNEPIDSDIPIGIVSSPACLTNPPFFNYSVGSYTFEVELPNNAAGYTVTYQTCCRVSNITNIGNAPSVGSTYVGSIPGTQDLPTGNNNSAQFETGISVICQANKFMLDFSATDADGDSLVYSTIDAFNGGAATNAGFANPAPPAYGSVPYSSPYSGFQPLGPLGVLNSSTGIISGIAPAAGKYIVCVLVKEYRNGVFVSDHRKDFIVTVAPCDFASSELQTSYVNCDSLTVKFKNESSSVLNLTFNWNFGDPSTGALNTSNEETPTHIYSAPGDYQLILTVNIGTPCAASDTSIVKVYPGFFPATDTVMNTCKGVPVQFNDITTTSFPPVNYWLWDFGDQTTNADTSRIKSPTYTYATAGNYLAQLIVGTTKGCRDTLSVPVKIVDRPNFTISKDTLICTIDTLQLKSSATGGTVTWTPDYMISNTTSFNPLVSPDVTTRYTAFYENPVGCNNTASVLVRVVNEVTLLNSNDTTICRTDSARLTLNTDALYFNWTPANVILDPRVKNPIVFPTDSITTFRVFASISNKCFKEDEVIVKTVPYPVANVTGQDPICFGKNSQLNATGGSIYLWSPPVYLNNINIPNPIAVFPKQSTTYTVAVQDTFGCPKPVLKTFKVNVIRIIADAGPSDTSVVLEQPLQLTATGSTNYLWNPATYLDNQNIATPISLPQNNITYTVSVSNSIGCLDIDTINVKVFFLPPDIYVPSAFTPSGDVKNDVFRPIALGIKSLESFAVYNRWGVLLFRTSRISDGWDGRYKGIPQDPGTYVWQANATDYKNKKIFRKGTVILIR